ncbi:MAG TPA: transglycosylase domain-containing protein [Kofleriaceae bacterium]|nr:transglycosylase domain-containing protein [Kofleriaceae bacterium]
MWVNQQRSNRRWVVLGLVSVVLCASLMVGVFVLYPLIGERTLQQKLAELGKRLDRTIIADIDVGFGSAQLRDLRVSGAGDGKAPLLHIKKLVVKFRGFRAMLGDIELDRVEATGVAVAVRRDVRGDNFSDLVDKVRGKEGTATAGSAGASRRLVPRTAEVSAMSVTFEDGPAGVAVELPEIAGKWSGGDLAAQIQRATVASSTGQRLSLGSITVKKAKATRALVEIGKGEVALWPKMMLTGVTGTVLPDPKAGHYRLSLEGGYGGVAGTLWKAVGEIDLEGSTATLDLSADKFNLDRLEPILQGSYLVDYAKTSVDANVHLEVNRERAAFSGKVHVRDLNVGHPMLADREVRHLDFEGAVAGEVVRDQRTATLTQGDFVARGLPFSITGQVEIPGGKEADGSIREAPRYAAHLIIPPIACQAVLASLPTEMVPYMSGYRLGGTFATDLQVRVNFANLQDTVLEGSVGIRNCRVKEQPEVSPKRLTSQFEHYVEVEKDQWLSFIVGPDNPDFVPYEEISPHLVNSIMTTEDSSFMKHRGFIVSEFRSALIKNLEAGYFRYGASSITMQLAKNVLLYREKTLSRKLQELFFTWDLENTLEKERILEIYFNVIEYGPGLYGIGPAAKHFFGKAAKDLTPVEAAFFSSILPAPKQRYQQYCKGTLTQWTSDKIERILGLMWKRGRLTETQYQEALDTPLAFLKDGSESEGECLARRARAIRKARPTNPLKQ